MRRLTLLLSVVVSASAFTLSWFAAGANSIDAGDRAVALIRSTTGPHLALLSVEGSKVQSRRSDVRTIAGAECPTGSGSYCSDELPYCCPGINVAAYCAVDVNGCTQ